MSDIDIILSEVKENSTLSNSEKIATAIEAIEAAGYRWSSMMEQFMLSE